MRCDRCEVMEDHRDALRAKLIRTREDYADEVDSLRAQLAAVEEKNRELEEQHAHDCDQFNRLAQEKADAEKDRAVANARVKALEAALGHALKCARDGYGYADGLKLAGSHALLTRVGAAGKGKP